MKTVNILGGGLGGLSAAHYLLAKLPNKNISIYEGSNRIGGWIKSHKLENGVIFQQAARTIRPSGPSGLNTLELIKELNILNKILSIPCSHPIAKNRMIYVQGKLAILPNSLMTLMKREPPFKKPLLFYLMNDLVAKKEVKNDESIYEFANRRFGKEVAEYLISPLICGICAGDAREISVKFLMESLFEKEQKHGSITKGIFYDLIKKLFAPRKPKSSLEHFVKYKKWSVYTFSDGLSVLPETLGNVLTQNGVAINLKAHCTEIQFSRSKVIMKLDEMSEIESDHIISSISSKNLANLIEKQHPNLSNFLRKIPFATVGVINLQYNTKQPIHDAFGILVPPCEKIPILGVIFDSCSNLNSKNTVLTVMIGGKWFNEYFGKDITKDKLLNTAKKYLQDILHITDTPDNYKVSILKDCIPQYIVGHKENLQNIEKYIQNNQLPLGICGCSYYGVGINDVILASKNAVMKL